MSLIGRLHTAEHESWEAAWQGLSRARTSLEEAQTRIRRKMRIYARAAKTRKPLSVSLREQDASAPSEPVACVRRFDFAPEESKNP